MGTVVGWLILWGGFAIFGQVVAFFTGDREFTTWGLACSILAAVLPVVGLLDDWRYNRKKRARYRLPFWMRWDGWKIGHQKENLDLRFIEGRDFINKKYYDNRTEKLVPIYLMLPPMSPAPKESRA